MTANKMNEGEVRYTLGKHEKLCSQKLIEMLFSQGRSISADYLRLLYLESELSAQPTVSILFAVPKKHLKKAVDRNRVKRLMREAYRLNSRELKSKVKETGRPFALALVYNSRKVLSYSEIETAIIQLISRFINAQFQQSENQNLASIINPAD